MDFDISLDDLCSKAGLSFERIYKATQRVEVLETLARRAQMPVDVVQIAMWETEWATKAKQQAEPQPHVQQQQQQQQQQQVGAGVLAGFPNPVPVGIPASVPVGIPTSMPFTGVPAGMPGAPFSAPACIPAGVPGVPVDIRQGPGVASVPTVAPPGNLTVPVDSAIEFVDPLKGTVLRFFRANEVGMYYTVDGVPRNTFTTMRICNKLGVVRGGPRLEFPELKTAATIPWDVSEVVLQGLCALAGVSGVRHNIPASGSLRASSATLPSATLIPEEPLWQVGVPDVPVSTSEHAPWRQPAMPTVMHATDQAATTEGSSSFRHDPYSISHAEDSTETEDKKSTGSTGCSTTGSAQSHSSCTDRVDRAVIFVREGGTLSVPPGTIHRIVNAKFGIEDRWFSATGSVRRRLVKGGIPEFRVTMAELGLCDPCVGCAKRLILVYKPNQIEGRQAAGSPFSPSPQ
eukprot:Hpha_TRINITY_DN15715_c2_g2::TRINITY_DN15715_c2_g2_i1::g.41414::m.41414